MDNNYWDNDLINSAKKKKMLFVLGIDTSASMKNKIGIVNEAIKKCIEKMKRDDLNHNIAKVVISILEFNKEATWLPVKPQEISNFSFIELECSHNAESNYGKFYQQLNSKLTKEAFLKEANDYHPIILLITDGKPTDDYDDDLDECEKNNWFHKATRVALPIIIDKDMTEEEYRKSIDYECIMDFTGQKEENIFSISNLKHLADMLEIVTMTTLKHKENKKKNNDELDLDDPFNDIRNKILKLKV